VQLDLVSYEVDVVNTTTAAVQDASLGARVYSLENELLLEDSQIVQAAANALTPGFKLELAPLLSTGMVFVRLTLNDAAGKAIADNFYCWVETTAPYRPLNRLPPASVSTIASSMRDGDEIKVHVQIENHGPPRRWPTSSRRGCFRWHADSPRIFERQLRLTVAGRNSDDRNRNIRKRGTSPAKLESGDGTWLPVRYRFRIVER